ncbi:putative quinol monooxygenase [Chengkuizengella marina]|uniref:Antibiotic biosynthesis monooxygenase n=1 Tax=Chengkuizengella marina TaxID=2507566 RepID=A0A6N9Q7I6_9BACL|nr:putative quinol monooxygenase [Chengkuizengella marina]NBI30865.1 antibiotic biosynthesis monooxygenase [Chengkuizengella marina]
MIMIHAIIHVYREKEQAFLKEVQSLIKDSRAESGNISYQLLKDTEKENVYMMVEEWKDFDAVQSHNSSKHFISFVGKSNEYLKSPLDVKVYDANLIKK